MAVAAQLGILGFEALDQLENLESRMRFESVGEQTIKALGAAPAVGI